MHVPREVAQPLLQRGVLYNLIGGKLKIQWDVVSKFYGGVQPEVEVQRLQTAHVWLDYFSIPQLVEDCPTPNLVENQLKYIQAIPAFVGRCDVFVALVPSNVHSDTGSQCNYNSWLQRGWCRTEMWCHLLSVRSKHPFLVVRSHDSAHYTAPLWHRYPVHMGDFSVEEDRARCCQVLQTALTHCLAQLCQSRRKIAYRLYLSLFEEMTGLDPKCRSVEDFLQEFYFSTAAGQRRGSCLSPVACAALSGDCKLVRALVAARASLQSHAPGMPEVLNMQGFTPLHLALWFKSSDLSMLETLLDLRADPMSSGINLLAPLGFCRSTGAVDLLIQHGAGVNFCGTNLLKYLPIHLQAFFGAPYEVVARMIELRADVRGGSGGVGNASPVHGLSSAGGLSGLAIGTRDALDFENPYGKPRVALHQDTLFSSHGISPAPLQLMDGSITTCHLTENGSTGRDNAIMWVAKVEHVLAMTGQFRPHQILKAEGLLEKWDQNMYAIFVSHEWSGRNHPDPNGTKLQVLQGLLRNLIAKKLKIQWDIVYQFYGGMQKEAEIQRLQTAHVWLDYFCVPQVVQGHFTPDLAKNQLPYIDAIPTFVGHCNLFLALVPSNMHVDTGSQCNFNSWLQRGWCRTELWCHFLSAWSKHPIVVVRSHDSAQYTAPLWHQYPVHMGHFSAEEDRARCSQVLQTALASHVSQLRQKKSKTAYRLYQSLFEDMVGLNPKCRSVEDFLQEFSFSTVAGQQRGSCLSPVACAALSGDCKLVWALVAARASLQSHALGMLEVLNLSALTLLDLRADPNCSSINFLPPLGYCRSAGAVDLLVQHGAGVNFAGASFSKHLPIHSLAAHDAPCEVLARMIELRADVRGGRGGLGSASPLHSLANAGDSKNTLEVAQLLLESRANINQVCQPEGICRTIELMSRAYGQYCSLRGFESGAVVNFFRDSSTTPLGWCVTMENEGLLTFLLCARADPEIRNNRGLRPIDFAMSDRVRRILKDPTQSMYLLEQDSELVRQEF
eukprot:Skav211105  [mRNA]  locus=scaffold3323:19083:36601:- [translate_table: standard]